MKQRTIINHHHILVDRWAVSDISNANRKLVHSVHSAIRLRNNQHAFQQCNLGKLTNENGQSMNWEAIKHADNPLDRRQG